MKRFALAALTFAALALGTIEGRATVVQPGGYRSAPGLAEVQYHPYYRSDRRYYYRQERRAAPSGGRGAASASGRSPGGRTAPGAGTPTTAAGATERWSSGGAHAPPPVPKRREPITRVAEAADEVACAAQR